MRQKSLNFLSVIIAFLLGVGAFFVYNEYVPEEKKLVENRHVTVTDTGISEAVDKVYDSVVIVHVEAGKNSGWGSGFVYHIDKDKAYLLTNHHVIENANSITVEFMDETQVKAKLVGSDKYADIAVLEIEAIDGLKVVEIGKTEELNLGDTVFTVGTPVSLDYKGSVTRGIVSGLDRLVSISVENNYSDDYIMKAIQVDAPINSGNSGGPLCNANGEVIGINTMKIASTTIDNMGFSIPIEDALNYAAELEQNGKIERPFLGLEMYELETARYYYNISLPAEVDGLYVESVNKNSPASKAGFKNGDIIIKFNKKDITSFKDFKYELYKFKPNEKAEVEIIRDGKNKTLTVTLGKSE